MRLIYAYAGFSLGIALYLIVLTVSDLKTPDIAIGQAKINLFLFIVSAFVIFTLYVIYKLRESGS
ncbi:MAG: hypothetical protein ABWU84_06245 [Pyrobaculum sp.]|uniref:hypothetical protein n=1 Tax=Pyrobaculum sp. TaxID=2004705 RepID=UPI003EE83131